MADTEYAYYDQLRQLRQIASAMEIFAMERDLKHKVNLDIVEEDIRRVNAVALELSRSLHLLRESQVTQW